MNKQQYSRNYTVTLLISLLYTQMDDQGMLQKESALEYAKKMFEDPEELKNIEDFLHSCAPGKNLSTLLFGTEYVLLVYKAHVIIRQQCFHHLKVMEIIRIT